MKLLDRQHRQPGHLVGAAGNQFDKLDGRAERVKIDRKVRLLVLPAQRVAQGFVAAMDADDVAGNVSRREKRKPHDVVPVQMRQEHVEAMLAVGPVFGEQIAPELAHAGAEVAQHVLVAAGRDLDASGVAAKCAAHRRTAIRDR